MPNKTLDADAIKDVLRHGTVVTGEGTARPAWPNADDRANLAKAVKAGDKTAIIDGEVYTIRYKTAYKEPTVFIRPKDRAKFVPCGYFEIRKLMMALTNGAD